MRSWNKEIKYDVTSDGCHICTSHYKNYSGYPMITINGKVERMSRYIFKITKEDIPPGLIVRHTCDNRACINPEHLLLGTQADNMRDRMERGRAPSGSNHWAAKLSDDEVLEIFNDKTSKLKVLAAKYGVTIGTICNIRTGYKRIVLRNLPCKK